MAADEIPPFTSLLYRFRVALGLTQEELAERAGVSARGISDLERGVIARPRASTLRRLAEALQLSADDWAIFERAALAADAQEPGTDGLPDGDFLGARPPRPLVAREEEGERLRAVLQAVAEGAGQLLLLHGELGVGKTRLAQELMLEARGRGYLVVTGRCYAAEQATPYYPFLEALGGLGAGVPASVRAEVRRRWARVAQVMNGNASDQDAPSGGTVEQRHVADAVGELLLLVAQAAPLALLLDDLHWADRPSLRLLQHLARAIRPARILVAGTFRDARLGEEHPELAGLLQDLTRERVVERLGLRRLSQEETTALVAATMGQPAVSEEFAGFVYRRTKGNPRRIDQLVRSLGGRLELQGEIGAGAMGRVFRAFDRTTGTTVAAKLVLARAEIPLDALLRFQQEGAVLATLSHPHIVTVHDTFAEEHASCIIMELLEGPSLGQLLRSGPLPLLRAKHIARQVAAALAYAHGQGIVHRDIKPDNVMVVGDDQVKVTDFGIARLVRPDTSLQTIATTGMRLGTPLYMAPEQIEGKTVDGRTDIYACGALLFHMVTGRPPFEGSEALAVAVKHLQEEPPRPSTLNPSVPAEWDALILTALAKDPAQRFQSAKELEQAVAALGTEGQGGAPTQPAATQRAHARIPRRRLAAAAGLLVLVVAMTATWARVLTGARPASLGASIDSYLSGLAAKGQLSGTVLVARHGTILLNKGYGLADRQAHRSNSAETRYPVGGLSTLLSMTGLLKAIAGHLDQIGWQSPICAYLPRCPASWRPITVRMLLDGTSHLPDLTWGRAGATLQQSLTDCQATPLDGTPGSQIDYAAGDCNPLVLAMLLQTVLNGPWPQVLSGHGEPFDVAGMVDTGQMTDALAASSPNVAHDYDAKNADPSRVYNDFVAAYATAADVLAFDNALFGGKLLSRRDTALLFTPRSAIALANPGVAHPRWGYYWKIGRLFGRRVVYTFAGVQWYQAVNLRFPDTGLTVVVLSNDASDDALGIVMNAAALALGRQPAPAPTVQTTVPPALLGTYRRVFQNADRLAAHDPGLSDWVGGTLTLAVKAGWVDIGLPGSSCCSADEYDTATPDGRLTLRGYLPANYGSFCSSIPTEAPPPGTYRWARRGNKLIITRVTFDPCLDRGAVVPGTWTKIR